VGAQNLDEHHLMFKFEAMQRKYVKWPPNELCLGISVAPYIILLHGLTNALQTKKKQSPYKILLLQMVNNRLFVGIKYNSP
jgi:hypothetical protein